MKKKTYRRTTVPASDRLFIGHSHLGLRINTVVFLKKNFRRKEGAKTKGGARFGAPLLDKVVDDLVVEPAPDT